MQSFNDRFTLKYPALASVNIDATPDTQLETLAPDVKVFADDVRGYSVIIRRRTLSEIYNICTRQVDPRISLILASARDNAGIRIFPDLDTVKALMFGPNDNSTEFEDEDLNIFVEGIRRAAAALTASILIGQLAQIDEQAQHAKILEQQALNDLDRIIKIPDLQEVLSRAAQDDGDDEKASLYFEKKEFNLVTSSLTAELYMPSSLSTGWKAVGTYTGNFSTSNIVADIADAINQVTLVNKTSNILSSPVLSESATLHRVEFVARERDATISAEVISIRFSLSNASTEDIPFKWGLSTNALFPTKLNSLLLTVAQGRAGTISASSSTKVNSNPPTVLYFRRRAINQDDAVIDYDGNLIPKTLWSSQGKLEFRISPNMAESVVKTIAYKTSVTNQDTLDKDRPSQVTEALLDGLYEVKGTTRALGALFRNDDPTSSDSYSAIELIAFSITNPETWLILDVLEIPADIEMAVGDLTTPLTPFSNKPRSIRVEAVYKPATAAIVTSSSLAAQASPVAARLGSSGFIRQALEKGECWRYRA